VERAKVVKDEIFEQNTHFLAVYVEAKNSCLILLSEKEDKLGTLVIAVPKPKDLLGPPSSSVLLGDKNAATARMFAENLAMRKEKIVLVSIYLETMDERQAQSALKRLLEKVTIDQPQKEGLDA
jgi:Proteasome assembly chaperone 4